MALRLALHFLELVTCLVLTDMSDSLCEGTSTLRMQNASLTVNEGDTVDVCVVASLGANSTGLIEVNIIAMGMESSVDLTLPSSIMLSFNVADGMIQTNCLTFAATEDNIFEDTETFTLSLSTDLGEVSIVDPTTTTVSIIDNDEVIIQMREVKVQVPEGNTSRVCADLTGQLQRDIVVRLTTTTKEGFKGAESDIDYLHTTMMKTFSAGNIEQCLNVTTQQDEVYEYWEIFNVTLTLVSPISDRIMITHDNTDLVIVDDENVTISMKDPSIVQTESDGNVEVCAVLVKPSGGLEREVIVQLGTNQHTQQSFLFSSGTTPDSSASSSVCRTYAVDNDYAFENSPVLSYTVILNSAQGRVNASGTTTVTVNDDDNVTISMRMTSISQNEMEGNVDVCARLDGPVGGLRDSVDIQFSQSGQASVTETFPSGATTLCYQLSFMDNANFESSPVLETTVSLSSLNPRVSATGVTHVSVVDDDDVTIGMVNDNLNVFENDNGVSVCARINSPAGILRQSVTVQFLINEQQPSENKVFPVGSRGDTQCVNFQIASNDDVFEESPIEVHTVSIHSTQSRVTASGTTTVTVLDNDNPSIAFQQTTFTFSESTPESVANICVVLEGPSGGLDIPFNVMFSIEDGTATEGIDYNAIMYQVTKEFSTSDVIGSTKCITITIVDDDLGEADEVFTVQITSLNSRVSIRGGATATIIIVDNEVFPAPLNLMASIINSRSLQLSWDPPDTRSTEVTLTGYSVFCNSIQVGVTVSASTINLVVNNLMPYTTYTCTVDANFGSNIGQSTPITETTFEDAPGSSPLMISKTLSTSSSITLSWSPPVMSYGIITHYNLYVDYNNGSNFNAISTENMYTISPLSPYQIVSVRISASTSVGEGPPSAAVDFTSDESISGPVGDLTANRVNGTSFRVHWTRPVSLNGVLSTYLVNITSDKDLQGDMFTTLEQSITVQNLAPYIPYKITVSAVNGAGIGEHQKIIAFTTEGVPIAHPRNVIPYRINGTSALVTWTHLSLAEARGFITNYNITYWMVGSDIMDSESILVPGGENSTIISGLDPDSQYYFRVSASTVVGQSNFSDPVILFRNTTFDQVPSLIVNLMMTIVNESTRDLTWTPPFNLNGVLIKYIVTICCWANEERRFETTNTRYRISDLVPFVPYKLAVSAENGAGMGPSKQMTFFTAQGAPLISPKDLAVSSISSTSAIITWKPLSLSEARGFITQYNVIYWQVATGSLSALTQAVSEYENSTIIVGLEPGTNYAVTVSASTLEGDGIDSNPLTFPTAGAEDTGAIIGGAVGGTVVIVVNVLIISVCFGLMVLYFRRRKLKGEQPQQNVNDTREYEEIQLRTQHPQILPTQKCEAYGFLENNSALPHIAPSVATEDHVYERVS